MSITKLLKKSTLLVLLIISSLCLVAGGAWAEEKWATQLIDTGPEQGKWSSIALDNYGRPHISYLSTYSLKHAEKYTSGKWYVDLVDFHGNGITGLYTSIALDSSAQAHISYHDSTSGDLKYAYQDGADWRIETVASAGDTGLYTSIALDSNGNPHISYYDKTSGWLKYVQKYGSQWYFDLADTSGDVGEGTSLALDSSDHPHISYYDKTNHALKYAKYSYNAGSAWVWGQEIVDHDVSVGSTSIALDSSGYAHIAYIADGSLKYARNILGLYWQPNQISYNASQNSKPSLAMDSNDRPHISWIGLNNLQYSWYNGSEWETKTVSGASDDYTSIVLDGSEQPHISYRDDTGRLKHAWYDGSQWNLEEVDSDSDVGSYTSIAIDGNNQPRISYVDHDNGNLKYTSYDGSTWNIEVADYGNVEGEYTSLALDSNDWPRISYTEDENKYLRYASKSESGWSLSQIVDGGSYSSLALDSSDRPFISYYEDYYKNLRLAWYDGKWNDKKVDYSGNVGLYTSIALDSSGYPHISYYDTDNNQIKHAWSDGTNWQTEVVESGDVGTYTSIAIDSSDRVHFSYNDWTNDDLRYARKDGPGDWYITTVDSGGNVGRYTSLVLDSSDRPHISYQDYTNDSLKYAWYDGSQWNKETVEDLSGLLGLFSSIALDSHDRPHISYYTSEGLKYAIKTPSLTQVSDFNAVGNNNNITLSWDYDDTEDDGSPATAGILIIRSTDEAAIEEDWVPTDGTDYAVGNKPTNKITIVYDGSPDYEESSHSSDDDGSGDWIDENLPAGQTYYYRAFAYDSGLDYNTERVTASFSFPYISSLSPSSASAESTIEILISNLDKSVTEEVGKVLFVGIDGTIEVGADSWVYDNGIVRATSEVEQGAIDGYLYIEDGNGNRSLGVWFSVLPPAPVENFQASAESSKVTLTWNPPADNVEGILIIRSTEEAQVGGWAPSWQTDYSTFEGQRIPGPYNFIPGDIYFLPEQSGSSTYFTDNNPELGVVNYYRAFTRDGGYNYSTGVITQTEGLPQITGYFPSQGTIGKRMVIYGENFGDSVGEVIFTTTDESSSWSAPIIEDVGWVKDAGEHYVVQAIVPEGAIDGKIYVKNIVNGNSSQRMNFTVVEPEQISDFGAEKVDGKVALSWNKKDLVREDGKGIYSTSVLIIRAREDHLADLEEWHPKEGEDEVDFDPNVDGYIDGYLQNLKIIYNNIETSATDENPDLNYTYYYRAFAHDAGPNYNTSEVIINTLFPEISGFAPIASSAETMVKISGKNFGSDQGRVYFTDRDGDISLGAEIVAGSWQTNEVQVVVPQGAVDGKVKLRRSEGGMGTSNASFEVLAPRQVWNFSATMIEENGTAILNWNYDQDANDGDGRATGVLIGRSKDLDDLLSFTPQDGEDYSVGSETDNVVKIICDTTEVEYRDEIGGIPGTYYYRTFAHDAGPNYQTLTSEAIASVEVKPYIEYITPEAGKPGTKVEIHGSNFGNAEGSVAFYSYEGSGGRVIADEDVTEWSTNLVTTEVPSSANSGPVYIIEGTTYTGIESNRVSFEVLGPSQIYNFRIEDVNFDDEQGRNEVLLKWSWPKDTKDVLVVKSTAEIDWEPTSGHYYSSSSDIEEEGVSGIQVVGNIDRKYNYVESDIGYDPTYYFRAYAYDEGQNYNTDTTSAETSLTTNYPSISNIIPSASSMETEVIIEGAGFEEYGSGYNYSNVYFSEPAGYGSYKSLEKATIISWEPTLIRVQVPYRATDGPVIVESNNGGSRAYDFNVLPLYQQVEQFTASWEGEEKIKLSWKNPSPIMRPSDEIMYLLIIRGTTESAVKEWLPQDGTYYALYSSYSDIMIVYDNIIYYKTTSGSITIKESTTESYNLQEGVTYYYRAFVYDDGHNFTTEEAIDSARIGPEITSITPSSSSAETYVEIRGYNFGSSVGKVKFADRGGNFESADMTDPSLSWEVDGTYIKVKVPQGAVDGGVVVEDASGNESAGFEFNVLAPEQVWGFSAKGESEGVWITWEADIWITGEAEDGTWIDDDGVWDGRVRSVLIARSVDESWIKSWVPSDKTLYNDLPIWAPGTGTSVRLIADELKWDETRGAYTFLDEDPLSKGTTYYYRAFARDEGPNYQTLEAIAFAVAVRNNQPVAYDLSITAYKNTPVLISLEATDTDEADVLSYGIKEFPVQGTLEGVSGSQVIAGNQVTYIPNEGYTGEDSFKFVAHDGTEESNKATVTITVKPPAVLDLTVLLQGYYYDSDGDEISDKQRMATVEVEFRADPFTPVLTLEGLTLNERGNVSQEVVGLAEGEYYLVVRQVMRIEGEKVYSNHLGVMTEKITFEAGEETPVDLSDNYLSGMIDLYGAEDESYLKEEGDLRLLWGGDADGNGEVNAIDATYYTNDLLDQKINPTADFNGSGEVDIWDGEVLLQGYNKKSNIVKGSL